MLIKYKAFLFLMFLASNLLAQKVGVFFDDKVLQFEFSVSEIEKAFEYHGIAAVLKPLTELPESNVSCNVVIALKSDARV